MAEVKGKKKWYEILATNHFNNQPIGETVANDDKSLIGRIIEANLGSLTRDAKLQNIKIKFKINEVKDGKAYTEIKGCELVNNYIKRITRSGRSKIDDSFLFITKDDVKIRIKPMILTKFKSQRSALKGIKDFARKEFSEYIKKETYDKIVTDLVNKSFQRELSGKLNKIYPISLFEIRVMQRI